MVARVRFRHPRSFTPEAYLEEMILPALPGVPVQVQWFRRYGVRVHTRRRPWGPLGPALPALL